MIKKYTSGEQALAGKYSKSENGCWLWQRSKRGKGYGTVWYDGRAWSAHRLAWVVFRGPIPDGLCVLHRCDTPACINPEHLFLGTVLDNTRDMLNKGRGCLNGRAKFSAKDVCRMREQYEHGGVSFRALAAQFGCSHTTVRFAVRRLSYVKDPGRAE